MNEKATDFDTHQNTEYKVGGFTISAFSSATHAYMHHAELQGAILHYANFAHSLFAFSKLVGADLSSANLVNVNFEFTDLTDANLKYANLDFKSIKGAQN